jgi:uncharacterized protein YtpQ (UPF0354 family)
MKRHKRSAERPSKDRFAKLVLDGIRQAGDKREIVYDRGKFRLTLADDSGNTMFLQNVYADYCNAPESDRDKTLARIVRNWFAFGKSMPEDFEDASHDLLPAVRDRSYFASAELILRSEGRPVAEVPYQSLGDDLAIALVYDLPDSMRTIGQNDLDRWGVSFYEALEVARSNLARIPCKFIGPQQGEGIYLSVTNDNYDACRLLLNDLIRGFNVKGDHIAMVPNRDTLIVTGSDDVAGIKGMVALAKDALQKPRPIGGLLLKLDGDEWVSWMPPSSHPHYDELRMLRMQTCADFYGHQKALLDKLHETTHEDIFVASYSSAEKKDTGEAWSYCIWANGVLALLPKSDRVMFMGEGMTPRFADWDRVIGTMGDRMQPMQMYPERYRVSEFPREAQFAEMGAKPLDDLT